MRLAVFTKNRTNPAYEAARLGAARVAARMDATVEHYVPVKPDDVAEQIALVDAALAAGHDAFVFVPVHVTELADAVRRINASGIPLVNILNRMGSGEVVSFVGSDDYLVGRDIAAYLVRHLDGHGRIVLVQGMPGAITSTERMRAFRDVLGTFPGIEVVATLQGEYQQSAGREAMAAFLASGGARFDAVLAANDAMALGVIEALEEKGARATVTGVNAVPDAIAAIRRGALLATADFDALKIACIGTEAAIRHVRGERVPCEIMLPTQVVDAGNCALWDRPLEERECPRWEDVTRALM
jgi:ribose transport system substrate-binding protein